MGWKALHLLCPPQGWLGWISSQPTCLRWENKFVTFFFIWKFASFLCKIGVFFLSDLEIGDTNDESAAAATDLGFSKWAQAILGKPRLSN